VTAPEQGRPGDRKARPKVEPVQFSEAEKLMAQWEAQHAVIAAGRRLSGLSVSEYVAHTRCTDPPSTTAHRGDQHGHRSRAQHRPPPDPHPHLSDLWGWLTPPPARGSGPADRRGDRGH
jgi:hypothetical protein